MGFLGEERGETMSKEENIQDEHGLFCHCGEQDGC